MVVGVVRDATVRRNARGNLIFTYYTFEIERALKGSAAGLVTIPIPGGTLDGVTHDTSVSVELTVGTRYLLFLEDIATPVLSPILGGEQGTFAEVVGADGVSRISSPILGGAPIRNTTTPLTFEGFVQAVGDLIRSVDALPPPPTTEAPAAKLPAKEYDPGAASTPESTSEPSKANPAPVPAAPKASLDQFPAVAGGVGMVGTRYVHQGHPSSITFNPLPLDWVWSPHDQYMMSYWNSYLTNNVFYVQNPTGTWAWGNDRFDLAGFPSNQQMIDQFGAGWGSSTLGITYSSTSGGTIVEADIALNPAFSWTLDNEYGTRSSGPYSFEQTMLHELGHSWGLKHPWETQNVWWDSVMNYAPKSYRSPTLFADDTNAIRSAYSGRSIRDGLISAYSTSDQSGNNNPTYSTFGSSTSTIRQLQTLSFSGSFKIENVGTTSLSNPPVEVYLCPTRGSWSNCRYLTTWNYTASLPTFYTLYLSPGTASIPTSVAPGTYWIGLFYRDDSDGNTGNNSSWVRYEDSLQVQACLASTWYRDLDGDGYGTSNVTTSACTRPSGYASVSGDCNDSLSSVHPGATEYCNEVDDDCDGWYDEGVTSTFYWDFDGDSYGDAGVTTEACWAPDGYVWDDTDCNDAVASIHPGATEMCNGLDDDCNGPVDEGVTSIFYQDLDGDTYGDAEVATEACWAPDGYVPDSTDCNDSMASINPGAAEIPHNGIDDDCDPATLDDAQEIPIFSDGFEIGDLRNWSQEVGGS